MDFNDFTEQLTQIERDVLLGAPLNRELVEKYAELSGLGKYQALNKLKALRLRMQLEQATTVQELKAVVSEMLTQLQGR